MQPAKKPISPSSGIRPLLACGVLIAPLFFTTVFVQAFTREGFDIRRAPLSLLSLGELGWIQIADFIGCGVLALACAAGLAKVLRGRAGGVWGPRLVASYGVGLIVAGIFHPDPGYGFPPHVNAPTGMLPTMSTHAAMHTMGFLIVVAALIGACFVFAGAFRNLGANRWRLYSIATGTAAPILLVIGIATDTTPFLTVMAMLIFGWLSAVAFWLISYSDEMLEQRAIETAVARP